MDNFLDGAGVVDVKRGPAGLIWISASEKAVRANSHYNKLQTQLYKKQKTEAKKMARKSGRKVSSGRTSKREEFIFNFGEDSESSAEDDSSSNEEGKHRRSSSEEEHVETSNSAADEEDEDAEMIYKSSFGARRHNTYVPPTKGKSLKTKEYSQLPKTLRDYATAFREKHGKF